MTFVCIYVAYSRPNGWTDCVEIFCGHSLNFKLRRNPILGSTKNAQLLELIF